MTRARNSANLASQGNLFVDITNDRTGIGSVVPAQNLHVAGTAGFHADVTFTGDNARSTFWDRSSGFLKFNDNAYIKMGTSNDMSIYHDGTNNIIAASVPKNLLLQSDDLQLQDCSNSHPYVKCVRDSYVRLYHDNSTRFQTAAYGVNVTGTTDTDGLIVSGVATVTTMNVTGVLTYEDVTSVDSVGIITARQDIQVGANIAHIGDTDTKIVFTNNQIDLQTGGSSRIYANNSGLYVKSGFPLAFLATGGGATPHIKSGGTNNQDLLLTTGSGNPTRLTIASDGAATFSGNVTVSGNLSVTGTTTQNNSVSTSQKTITLASGAANNAAVDGAGIVVDAGSDTDKTLKWLDSTDRWTFTGGDVAANAFYGDGSNLTGISGVSIANQANNRLITATGTTDALNAEGNLTFSGDALTAHMSAATPALFIGDSNRTSAGQHLAEFRGYWDGNHVARIVYAAGDDTTNKDDGIIKFHTTPSGGGITERARITSGGQVLVGTTQNLSKLTVDTDFGVIRSSSDPTINLLLGTTSSITQLYRILIDDSDSDKLQIRDNDTPRITMTSSGFLGINQTSPQRYLHITGNDGATGATLGNSDTQLVIDNTGSNGAIVEFLSSTNGAARLMFTDTGGTNRGRVEYSHNGDYLRLDTAGSERLRIDSNGTTTMKPATHDGGLIIVAANANQETRLTLTGKHSNGTSHSFLLNAKRSVNRLDFVGGGTTRASLLSTGEFGIGTVTQESLLQVGGGTSPHSNKPTVQICPLSGNAVLTLRGGSPTLYFDRTSSGTPTILTDGADLAIKNGTIDNYSSILVHITSSGDMGVGTNSPDRRLDVSGTGNVYGKFQSTNTTGAGIEVKDSSEDWLIQADGGVGPGLAFYDLGRTSYRMVIDSSGRLLIGATGANMNAMVQMNGRYVDASSSTVDLNTTGSEGPTLKLHTSSNSANHCAAIVFDHGSLKSMIAGGRSNTSNWGTDLRFYTHKDTTSDVHETYERLRITSDGNIGFNRSSGLSAGGTQTQTQTATPSRIVFNNHYSNGYTDASLKVYLFNDGNTRHGFTSGPAHDLQYHASGASYSKHTFYTQNNKDMHIEAGQVFKPRQFEFIVESNGASVSSNSWNKLTGLSIDSAHSTGIADGTYWSNSNQRFTVPVTGTYMFFFGGWSSINTSTNNNRYATCFRINGGSFKYIFGGSYCAVDSPMDGTSIVYKLGANDYIELWYYSNIAGTWGGGHRIFWGGYLLG